MGAIILLSHERSGSHLLGEYLGSLRGVKAFDEVCNPDATIPRSRPESLFAFRLKMIQADPDLLLEPTRQKHDAFLRAYFEHLQHLSSSDNVVVDIKYGHLPNFEGSWSPLLGRPFLLKFCEREELAVLHLYRRNVVEAAASALIARQRALWSSPLPLATSQFTGKIALIPSELVQLALVLERQNRRVANWIGEARALSLTYEEIAAKLGRDPVFDRRLADFAGGELEAPFLPRNQKVTAPLPEAIENYGAVADACRKAGLAHHLPTEVSETEVARASA